MCNDQQSVAKSASDRKKLLAKQVQCAPVNNKVRDCKIYSLR